MTAGSMFNARTTKFSASGSRGVWGSILGTQFLSEMHGKIVNSPYLERGASIDVLLDEIHPIRGMVAIPDISDRSFSLFRRFDNQDLV